MCEDFGSMDVSITVRFLGDLRAGTRRRLRSTTSRSRRIAPWSGGFALLQTFIIEIGSSYSMGFVVVVVRHKYTKILYSYFEFDSLLKS